MAARLVGIQSCDAEAAYHLRPLCSLHPAAPSLDRGMLLTSHHRPPDAHPAAAAPTFLRCIISCKKVGLHAYGSSAPRLEACSIEKCKAQGVRAQESATPALYG